MSAIVGHAERASSGTSPSTYAAPITPRPRASHAPARDRPAAGARAARDGRTAERRTGRPQTRPRPPAPSTGQIGRRRLAHAAAPPPSSASPASRSPAASGIPGPATRSAPTAASERQARQQRPAQQASGNEPGQAFPRELRLGDEPAHRARREPTAVGVGVRGSKSAPRPGGSAPRRGARRPRSHRSQAAGHRAGRPPAATAGPPRAPPRRPPPRPQPQNRPPEQRPRPRPKAIVIIDDQDSPRHRPIVSRQTRAGIRDNP